MIGCKVNIKYGDRCAECDEFKETKYLSHFGGSRVCVWCLGKISARLKIIGWKASEIGHLSSSAVGSAELIGIEAIEDVLTSITELSNEIADLIKIKRRVMTETT